MGNGIVNELINKLYKQQNLEDELNDLRSDIMFLKKKLTKEELEDLSYEDFKWLWDKVGKYYFYKICKKPDLSWDKK